MNEKNDLSVSTKIIERDLKHFTWRYQDGYITLVAKHLDRVNDSVTIPIHVADSLSRALLTFKTRHRIEQVRKARKK